ncbi:MAG: Hpt domain-containing protein [Scytolyngbya sp. HA4215-MV1]|nr:Hpt domain-containing protein [Scytolyngbya sp. HA4215-MV1]
MQGTRQQQILGYFIEEAKEHLDTIEYGLLNLQSTMADLESVNELFRAAHSIKGGAAMLGFESIQKTAHYLEDCFKILKEHPVAIDQKLETLFLQGFDTLKDLLDKLQSPYGFQEKEAAQAVKAAEPTFAQLEEYLAVLLRGGEPAVKTPAKTAISVMQGSNQSSVSTELPSSVHLMTVLKQMLQLFKQRDSSSGRQQLLALCDRLMQLGGNGKSWQALVETIKSAISNSNNPYSVLAPIVIKDLKQASDLLLSSRGAEIAVSSALQKLVKTVPVAVAAPSQPFVQEGTNTKVQQVSLPLETRAASKVLLNTFSKDQLVELIDLVLRAIQ